MSIVKDNYKNKVVGLLKDKFGYKNELEVPRVEKVSVSVTFNYKVDNSVSNDFIAYVVATLAKIAGQKPVLVKARKSIAAFKLKAGIPISAKVTLRKDRMYEFLDRLIYIALPRIKDFRGLDGNAFNQSGHYSFGIKEHTIFPEVELDKVLKVFGIYINVITTAKSKEECKALLSGLLFPIK